MLDRDQRYQGCLLGLAAGDAVGTTLEFKKRDSYAPITDMVGGGPFNLQAGEWTDDTSMALCLAYSLLEKGFDPADQMRRYCHWRQKGYMSSNGRCFDIGITVSEALNRYRKSGEPFSGSTHPLSAGNGSLMRLAPVALYYSPDLKAVVHNCGESSRTTHGAAEAIDACRYFGALLHLALSGAERDAILLSDVYTPETDKLRAIQRGHYLDKHRDQIRGSGYVVDCLEAALWCFAHTDSFADAILMAANLGEDADTTAAVCGQLAGAFYGVAGIPQEWQQKIVQAETIMEVALKLGLPR